MARGWESKSVESQQADTRPAPSGPALTPEARARLEQRQSLDLSLARVRDDLTRASQPAHRAMLERAAAALEAAITALS